MSFNWLSTEIIVALIGILLLVLSSGLNVRGKEILTKAAVASMFLVLLNAIVLFSREQSLFNGVYVVDSFGNFFKILFLLAVILVLLSSLQYIKRFKEKICEFVSLMIFAAMGMIIMVSAGDLITLYVGMELMTISFYILSAFLLQNQFSAEAGLKYLVLGAISSAVLLFGMSLIYAVTGTTVISEIAVRLRTEPALIAGVVMMLAGFGFKIAAVPFHMWVPDIYEGSPIPVTTFLAVGSKAAGFAAFLRVFVLALPLAQFNWSIYMAVIAALTMVAGNLIAIVQTDVKRLLAYSSIAQAGYILAGLAAANTYGLKGMLFYAMLYVFSTTGAFAVTTAVEVDTGSTGMEAFAGLSRRSPMLAAIMTICMLSLAGIPPLAGFVGKFYLFSGAVQSGYLWLALIGLIMSMVSVYYYLSLTRIMYIGESASDAPINPGLETRLALWICLLATVFIGIYPAPLSGLAQAAIKIFI
ncbi:MAG: NADH-quinone oxidoreductase subunit N [Syntrophomonadaceae bacterium]|nr:NADH-quinone oxidoreductase subunit N [Syntrophomonadaceae bacterium]MDD3022539.1 NADH-quinone oxidoreductase subunit N [Syntrophomonadaceae bacterium]